MIEVKIEKGGVFEEVPPGVYQGTFQGVNRVESKTDKGEAWRWAFKADDGRVISDLSDTTGAKITNKLGRWLCLLANRPLDECTVVIDHYIGKRYIVVVEAKPNGKSKIATFSALPS